VTQPKFHPWLLKTGKFISDKKWVLSLIVVAGGIICVLEFFGIIWHNALFAARYPITGLDVSHHQGNIDWQKVADTRKYTFVYIKATEGHDFTDDLFKQNWQGAKAAGLQVGAYHFFSVRSSGQEQAELFIANVPKDNTALAPVIDIEIDISRDKTQIRRELQELVSRLENYYQQPPILYVTYDTYQAYIQGNFRHNPIWIRDILKPPAIPDRAWSMWQYTNRGRVPGIATYVDVNVLNGEVGMRSK
jgi:lysozyme